MVKKGKYDHLLSSVQNPFMDGRRLNTWNTKASKTMTSQKHSYQMDAVDLHRTVKAELHIHLEGSLDRVTLDRIGARKGLEPLDADPYVFNDFEGFNAVFLSLARFLEEEADFYDAALALAERQARDRVVYTEAFIMPLFHLTRGVPVDALCEGVEAGLRDGEERFGGRIRLLFSIPRSFGPEPGFQTLELLENHSWDRVLGIDLAGMEQAGDMMPFAPVFEKARSMGLHTVAHAGELTNAGQVSRTLDLLRPERIGHGIRAVEDPALLERLAREEVPLEVCPTSNLRLGTVPSMDKHPVRKLFDAGVPLIINTDDPAFFDTKLSEELGLLSRHFGFTPGEVRTLVQNSFQYAFGEGVDPNASPRTVDRSA